MSDNFNDLPKHSESVAKKLLSNKEAKIWNIVKTAKS